MQFINLIINVDVQKSKLDENKLCILYVVRTMERIERGLTDNVINGF